MAYDGNGNLTAETDPDGNVTTFQYDGNNNQTVTINPLGNKTTTTYTAAEQVSTVTDADGPGNHLQLRQRGPRDGRGVEEQQRHDGEHADVHL